MGSWHAQKNTLLFLALFSATGISMPVAQAYTNQEFTKVLSPQEARIDQYRTAEIKQLQLVLSRSAPQEKKPDLMLRLAELYTEKYRLFFLKENEIWSKKMDSYLAMPLARQKVTRKPVLDGSISRRWLGLAVKVLGQIPLQKERYARIDEVYYYLAFNQWELGRKQESVKNFANIVRVNPKSKYASEAYRYMADYAFANRNFRRSKSYYQRAVSLGDTPARPRILYGLAWSEFKLHEYQQSVKTMHEAIVIGRGNEVAAKAGLALQSDAAESLALFYSEGGKVSDATAYFLELFGEADGPSVLRKLAEIYQSQGKYAKALAVNKQLLALGGEAAKQSQEQRFEIMVNSLNVATAKGDRDRQVALLKAMTGEFVTNVSNPEEEKVEILRKQVRKTATLAHREGNKSRNAKSAFRRAEDLYRLYLGAFGNKIDGEDAAEVHYYLADVLSQLGKSKEASAEYKLIMDKAREDSNYKKYGKDAAAGMVYSIDSYFKGKGGSKNLSKEDGDQVIGAIDSYVQNYPNDKETTKYLARAAGILVTSGRMTEAKPRLLQIIDKYPRSPEAMDAAGTLLKDAEKRKDYQEAQDLAQGFLGNRVLLAQDRKGAFKKQLESISARASFQRVKQVEHNSNFADAARDYEKLATSAADREVRMTSLNNAAVNYAKAGDHENELRIYKKILQSSPGNREAENNIQGIGNAYFLSGRYAEATRVYEEYYEIYEQRLAKLNKSSQESAFDAIRSAALLRQALHQNPEASEDFRKIVNAANKGLGAARDTAGEFLFDTAKRLRDQDNGPEAIRSFQKYTSAFPTGEHVVGATMETALLYDKLKEHEKAQNYLRATISKVKAKGRKASQEELSYAARARLELLGPLEEAFEKAPLRLPEKQLKSDINAKLAALERLNKGYIEVMDFGDGTWGVEAFRRMAMAYRTFGTKLQSAPVPTEYSTEDKAKFRAQLRQIAKPVFVKETETLNTALQKGEQLQVVGPVMARVYILASLHDAKPDRLPLIQGVSWDNAVDWIMGDIPSSEEQLEQKRKILTNKPNDLASWVAIGNYHLVRGERDMAKIFYLYASGKNAKYVPAMNNLAYLRGNDGDIAQATAGFKTALNRDEFAVAPKKNLARIQMASGLWRHANLAYRQLQVRNPQDSEVKRGLAASYLALGKIEAAQQGADLLTDGSSVNAKFAEAVFALTKGDRKEAENIFKSLVGKSAEAQLILDYWNTKESEE